MQIKNITLLFISTCMFTISCAAAPVNSDNDNYGCCEDNLGVDMTNTYDEYKINNDEYIFNDKMEEYYLFEEINDDVSNLIQVPFTEQTINDFGIHKYVISRNIKSLMTYHSDSHLVNIIYKSLNQSTNQINSLINENIHELNAMAENKFISNFLDFWCAYRMMQLANFTIENIDTLTNMVKTHYNLKI